MLYTIIESLLGALCMYGVVYIICYFDKTQRGPIENLMKVQAFRGMILGGCILGALYGFRHGFIALLDGTHVFNYIYRSIVG
jgi:hypothetical protein